MSGRALRRIVRGVVASRPGARMAGSEIGALAYAVRLTIGETIRQLPDFLATPIVRDEAERLLRSYTGV